MSDKMRGWLGLSISVVALALACVLYQWLPSTAGAFGRLVVSASLASPLFAVGLVQGTPPSALGKGGTRRVLLGTAGMAVAMAREAARMRGTLMPPMLEVASQGVLLALLGAMAWAWWKARHPSPTAGVRVR